MDTRKNPLALVTAASRGTGLALAKLLAQNGYDLIATSDDRMELKEAAQQLRQCASGMRVDTIVCDLARPQGAQELYDTVRQLGREIDCFASTADPEASGSFAETDLAGELALIQANAASAVAATKLFLRDMAARGTGRILILCGCPKNEAASAVKAATNAFLAAFARRLAMETKGGGVGVTLSVTPEDGDAAEAARAAFATLTA
ncbi:MAG TPA: SDR family NAD(P)-dependent oxidoreductase [Rhizomicrobium sp.]|jgi:hypothetical protein